jgi:hypothetical protein
LGDELRRGGHGATVFKLVRNFFLPLENAEELQESAKLPSPPPHKGSSWPASPLSLVYYA